jgi:hypothetical protein
MLKFNLKVESTYSKQHLENSSVNRAFKTSASTILVYSDIKALKNYIIDIILCELGMDKNINGLARYIDVLI